jgi:hypothetical protein
MAHSAGLDVSIEETAVCVVDNQGAVVMRCFAPTEPEAKALAPFRGRAVARRARGRVVVALAASGIEGARGPGRVSRDPPGTPPCRPSAARPTATDVLGLAHLMRTGWFRQAYVKTDGAYRLKLPLTHRRNLKRKFLDLENAIRHSLRLMTSLFAGTSNVVDSVSRIASARLWLKPRLYCALPAESVWPTIRNLKQQRMVQSVGN